MKQINFKKLNSTSIYLCRKEKKPTDVPYTLNFLIHFLNNKNPYFQGKGSGESSPVQNVKSPPENQAVEDTENPSGPIKELTKLGGSQSENLKTVDKMVKSAHYHVAEDTKNLSRQIDELTRHAESHSKRLEDVVKHAETQASKEAENLSGATEKIIVLVESLRKRLEEVVQMVQRTPAALSWQTELTSHVESPRPTPSPRMSGYIVKCFIIL